VAEGFATAASVAEVSGCPCLVAFSAQNIPAVVVTAKRTLPGRRIVVVADNDLSGVGQRVAEHCAQQHGVQVVIPPVAGQDANDYLLAGGDLAALLRPRSDWLVSFDEFAQPVPPAPYLVKGWLYQRQLALLVGPAGKGKTFLALDWALSVATGRTWHGQRVHRASVLYLAGEAHESLRRRALAWKQYYGVQNLGHSFLSLFGRDLNSPGGYEQVVEHCEIVGLEPQLIVIDTLHRAFRGNENSAEDTRTMLDACDRLVRHFDAAVLLVHHTGWGEQAQERGRGSSAWRAGVDAEILLVPQESDDCSFQIVQTKSRDAMPSHPIYFRLQSVEIEGWTDEDGEPVMSAVLAIAKAPEEQKKKPSKDKLEAHVETIESAWWATGEQVVDGAPFLSRDALRQYLIEQRGISPDSADVYLRPSSKGKLIAELATAKVVEAAQDNAGWRIVDAGLAASLLLRKAGDRLK
jgi:putative DNA primase/helicase